ncbi:MAG: TetR/AcrR family transcriptional regulator [Aeromicrobium erythreum]
MSEAVTDGGTRFERRRARTRAALVGAAQSFIAEGNEGAPIQEVTERADVGIGTFYNHFSSREELMRAALDDAVEAYAQMLDALGDAAADPAAFFAHSFRVTGRLHRVQPETSRVLLAHAQELARSPRGMGPRARRDIAAAHEAGVFDAPDLDVAMVHVVGALVELGHLLHDQPDRDVDATVDAVTEGLLVALGMDRSAARVLCSAPLEGVEAAS